MHPNLGLDSIYSPLRHHEEALASVVIQAAFLDGHTPAGFAMTAFALLSFDL